MYKETHFSKKRSYFYYCSVTSSLVKTELPSLQDTLCPCWILWGNREWLQTGGSVIKSIPVLWEMESREKRNVSRPSAPPSGRSKQHIWLRKKRRRCGMLLSSSALWKFGAKIADSSSIHTGSRSTHFPVRHIERSWLRWEAQVLCI